MNPASLVDVQKSSASNENNNRGQVGDGMGIGSCAAAARSADLNDRHSRQYDARSNSQPVNRTAIPLNRVVRRECRGAILIEYFPTTALIRGARREQEPASHLSAGTRDRPAGQRVSRAR